ncbi:MAG: hypothetical protein M1830_006729 [Pleopsidium flavum]|nr:MAG: hypothetical protein M1830_006729 [Pleopsidium flavum]
MSRLIAVAPSAKAFLSALFWEHCTIGQPVRIKCNYIGRSYHSREPRPSFGQVIKVSQTANAKTNAVNTTTTLQYMCMEGRRSTRCLKKDRKANFTEKMAVQNIRRVDSSGTNSSDSIESQFFSEVDGWSSILGKDCCCGKTYARENEEVVIQMQALVGRQTNGYSSDCCKYRDAKEQANDDL